MATGEMSRAAALAVRGALSGILAWAAILGARKLGIQNDTIVPGLQIGAPAMVPGLTFGFVLGAYLAACGRLTPAQVVLFWLASGIAYYVAYHVAYHLVADGPLGEGLLPLAIAGIVAGFCGSALLGLLSMPLLQIRVARLRRSIAVGGLAGVLLPLIAIQGFEIVPGLLAFFVAWQAAYAASLAPAVEDPVR
jgi:hypothetical protein